MTMHPRSHRTFPVRLRRPLAMAVALALTPAAWAQNLPTGFSLKYGSVDTPATSGNTMTVKQRSNGAIIEWNGFDIAAGYHVDFQQPGVTSVVLNRVTGGSTSQINGMLSANGRVFVVNTAGVMFGQGAQVNVGGLVASTLNISDSDFETGLSTGHFVFNGSPSTVENAGQITASQAGTVALLSGTVNNSGTISAPGGTIAVGGGSQVTLDIGGDGLTQLTINTPFTYGNNITNSASGNMQADGGKVNLSTDTLTLTAGLGVVNQQGVVQARSMTERGGVIELGNSVNSTVQITGSNDTRAVSQGVAGGDISVQGNHVVVSDGASFNAGGNGAANGNLTIDSQASILVSGKDTLIQESGDATLQNYTLLQDSVLGDTLGHGTNVTINAQGNPGSRDSSGVYDGSIWLMAGGDSGTTDVNGNEVYFADAQIAKNNGGDAQLTFQANRNIVLQPGRNTGVSIRSSSAALGLDLDADSHGLTEPTQDFGQIVSDEAIESGGVIQISGATIRSNGGDVRLYGQGDPLNGRAVGAVTYSIIDSPGNPASFEIDTNNGVTLNYSNIDTGAGNIILRGQATTLNGEGIEPGQGVVVAGSKLTSGAGNISFDGIGGTGGAGVQVRDYLDARIEFGRLGTPSMVQSSQGSIAITGVSGNAAADDNAVVDDVHAGVEIIGASQVLAGGALSVIGQGADLAAPLAYAKENGLYQAPSDGIDIVGATLQAGSGQMLILAGTAGSAGTGTDADGNAASPVAGIRMTDIAAATGGPLSHPEFDPTVEAAGGSVTLKVNGDLYLDHGDLSVSAIDGNGGNLEIEANNLLLGTNTQVLADGIQGGQIHIQAANVGAMDATVTLSASANGANGDGGNIVLLGNQGLYAYGSLAANGGGMSGNGGAIETSGSGVDLTGLRISANSHGGNAGSWTIDPQDITIVHGAATGSLPTNPFAPSTDSIIQDSDISQALNAGTNVTITSHRANPAFADSGNVTFNQVDIERTAGTTPVTFQVNAAGTITSATDPSTGLNIPGGTIVSKGAGPLNIIFNANADNGGHVESGDGGPTDAAAWAGYIDLVGMNLLTNGGNVLMYGQSDPVNGFANGSQEGIHFWDGSIDTRVGQSDAGAGGNVMLRGLANNSIIAETGIDISGTSIQTSTGNIAMTGVVTLGDDAGIGLSGMIVDDALVRTTITTTSGNITFNGTSLTTNDAAPKLGVRIGGLNPLDVNGGPIRTVQGGVDISTQSGNLSIAGRAEGDATKALINTGVELGTDVNISNTRGNTLIAGQSTIGTAAGVAIDGGTIIQAGSGNLAILSSNNGNGDALVINGDISGTGAVDLRPGGVDAAGNITESPNTAILIGNGNGFAVGATDLGHIDAGTLVIGSDIHRGDITVTGPVAYDHDLTLENGSGGDITINGAVNVAAHTLGLISQGNITQSAPLTAGSLLAQSTTGNVDLTDPGNAISADTVAGSSNGDFRVVNAGTVGIGNVSANGFSATSGTATALAGSGIRATDVLVQAVNGDMHLGADVVGHTIVLASSGIFDNNGGNLIASGRWQVWGSSWVGEDRNGLAGSGNLPNIYGCTYGGACLVTPSSTGNQFIYTARPTITVDIANSTREYGAANDTIQYTVNGLVLGDQANSVLAGATLTDATQASHVGNYQLGGNFTSPAGYQVTINPGTLTVTPATLTYIADSKQRTVGTPNGTLSGTVTGFRNGDTLDTATTGTLQFVSPADSNSPTGRYAIFGQGLFAQNYVFVQAPGDLTALAIMPPMQTYAFDLIENTPVTYLYDRNFGMVGLCPATDLTADGREQNGDVLARQWSRVRSRPNLANCVSTKQKNSCGDF